MPKYKVRVGFTAQGTVYVDAPSAAEAEAKAQAMNPDDLTALTVEDWTTYAEQIEPKEPPLMNNYTVFARNEETDEWQDTGESFQSTNDVSAIHSQDNQEGYGRIKSKIPTLPDGFIGIETYAFEGEERILARLR